VTCHNCQTLCNRFGKHRNGLQRYRCAQCRKTFTEDHAQPLGDMRLPMQKAGTVLKLLVEGMSLRSIERVTGVHRDTIMRLLILAGERSQKLMYEKMRGIKPSYLQCDEIWTFCQKKQRHVRKGESPDFGDQWVFVALDEETKLVPHFELGKRSKETTLQFLNGLKWTLADGRFQITTDGFHFYRAIQDVFAGRVDFAQLVKLFGDYTDSTPAPMRGIPHQESRRLYPRSLMDAPTRSIFLRHSWNARISRCGCSFAALHD
jgi:transposase-like protein/IS1 family transposase